MEEKIKELLEEEIRTEIKNLSSMKSGSDEKSKAIDDLIQLHKMKIEEDKVQLDSEDKHSQNAIRTREEDVKEKQLTEESWNRYIRYGLEAAGIILPMIFYAHWMKKGFEFEKEGTFTSTTFRSLFNRFKPTNKN